MKEFGSDFHSVIGFESGRAHLTDIYNDAVLMADGRQCLIALISQEKWRRIWMPEYFCHEVINTIQEHTNIEIVFYPDCPTQNDRIIVEDLPFMEGDVLLRINYFGMRNHRSEMGIPVSVIEDHTHDLLGHWALYSNADWCIASLRKTLPTSEGGMIWSPKKHYFNYNLQLTEENKTIASIRWEGMDLKANYLLGGNVKKEVFRQRFIQTEKWFDAAGPMMIDERSRLTITKKLDINLWQGARRRNWFLLCTLLNKYNIHVLKPEDESCTMFSLVLLFPDKNKRDSVREELIKESVYPAILWNIPNSASVPAKDFSERMLSIHCDGRYSDEDLKLLSEIMIKIIDK